MKRLALLIFVVATLSCGGTTPTQPTVVPFGLTLVQYDQLFAESTCAQSPQANILLVLRRANGDGTYTPATTPGAVPMRWVAKTADAMRYQVSWDSPPSLSPGSYEAYVQDYCRHNGIDYQFFDPVGRNIYINGQSIENIISVVVQGDHGEAAAFHIDNSGHLVPR